MKRPTETALVQQVLDYLALRGWFAWRNNTGAARLPGKGGRTQLVRFGVAGAPDVMALLPPHGRLLCCECKRPGGRLTAAQRTWLGNAEKAGALCVVAHTLAELERALDAEGV